MAQIAARCCDPHHDVEAHHKVDIGLQELPSKPKLLALVAAKRSYRLIGREFGLSKNTVAANVRKKVGDVIRGSRTLGSG